MPDTRTAQPGSWVEVECTLLEPADRSKNLPPDTAAQPLRMWVKGFLQTEAEIGQQAMVETITGRRVTGTLTDIDPGYFHTFGRPIPELAHVGRDLRERLAAYRAATPGAKGGA